MITIDSKVIIPKVPLIKQNDIDMVKKYDDSISEETIITSLRLFNYAYDKMPVNLFMNKFGINFAELKELFFIWKSCGKNIDIIQDQEDYYFRINPDKIELSNDFLNYEEYLVVSNTRFGSVNQQLHLLNDLYLEAYNRGIKTVFHTGNMTDGRRRVDSIKTQFLGPDSQIEYVINMYPYIKGLQTKYILGSSDWSLFDKKIDIISKIRPDMDSVGFDYGTIKINHVNFLLLSQSSTPTLKPKYRLEQAVENYKFEYQPDVLFLGNSYHNGYYYIDGVHCVNVPNMHSRMFYQTKNGLNSYVGGYFIKIYTDKSGNIIHFIPEEIRYSASNFWEEAGKDSYKVKKLSIENTIY